MKITSHPHPRLLINVFAIAVLMSAMLWAMPRVGLLCRSDVMA